jgi:hypothetical protein
MGKRCYSGNLRNFIARPTRSELASASQREPVLMSRVGDVIGRGTFAGWTGLRCVGPASSFCRSLIFAAALVHKTRISRWRESEDYSDSSCGGEDNGARPDHHRNNSSTRSGGALVCRAPHAPSLQNQGKIGQMPAMGAKSFSDRRLKLRDPVTRA